MSWEKPVSTAPMGSAPVVYFKGDFRGSGRSVRVYVASKREWVTYEKGVPQEILDQLPLSFVPQIVEWLESW